MRERKRWLWLFVAAALVGASISVVPALGQTTVTADFGVLRLQLDNAADRLVFDPVATGSNLTQNLGTTQACRLASLGPATLVAFTGFSPTDGNAYPGFKDNSIGVGQRGEGNGEPCGQVDSDLDQTLTLALDGALDGKAIDYAEIDIEFKFEGEVDLVLTLGGDTVDTITVPCNEASDCGPDSGGNDNLRVVLFVDPLDDPGTGPAFQANGVFDSIEIVPRDPLSVSLEGGGDNPASGDETLFNIVQVFEGQIDCGEDESEDGDGVASTITRGNDTNGLCKGPVDGLLFNFDSGTTTLEGEEVLFVDFVTEPVEGAAVAQYVEVITWDFDAPPDVPGGADQHITLFYDDHVGDGIRVMPWCEVDPRDSGGVGGLPSAGSDPDTILPDDHTSCLISSTSFVDGDGDFTVTDIVYNIGDGIRLR